MARVIMSPDYELKAELAAASEVFNVARDIASDVRGNIRRDGLIKSGRLLRSVRVRRLARGRSRVSIGTRYWWYLEYGTPSREIVAPPGKVLTFVKENGERVFTQRIRHPGNRAYRIVRRAVYKKRSVRG